MQFVDTLNRFGEWLTDRLWQMSLELAVLAVVVVLVPAASRTTRAAAALSAAKAAETQGLAALERIIEAL